jgi:hypothetical protein
MTVNSWTCTVNLTAAKETTESKLDMREAVEKAKEPNWWERQQKGNFALTTLKLNLQLVPPSSPVLRQEMIKCHLVLQCHKPVLADCDHECVSIGNWVNLIDIKLHASSGKIVSTQVQTVDATFTPNKVLGIGI